MADLFSGLPNAARKIPPSQGLQYGYEKAGQIVDDQPIPWNAEAALVKARVRLPAGQWTRGEFGLRVGGQLIPAESLRHEEDAGLGHLGFRFSVPVQSSSAELLWRDRSLGQMMVPILSLEEFRKNLSLHMPTVTVRLGEHAVACQTFVARQCQGMIASAILQSPTSLVPIVDLGLRVEVRSGAPVERSARSAKRKVEKDDLSALGARRSAPRSTPLQLASSQLKACQALLSLDLPKPQRSGTWTVTWFLGDEPMAVHKLRTISQKEFLRSLRISTTRFVIQNPKGDLSVVRHLPPLKSLGRVGPCFWVCSKEAGMAGVCQFQIRAQVENEPQTPLLQEQEVLISDGPTPLVPGTLDARDLTEVKSFELRHKDGLIGILPMAPAPTAAFSAEGSFQPPPSFAWSPLAEEQLQEKLASLLSGQP